MRIALVGTYLPPHLGGIERINESLLEGYRRAGHDVRCITSRVPRDLPARDGPIVRVACANAAEDRLGVPVPLWGREAVRELRAAAEWADAVHVVEALYQPAALAARAARAARKPLLVTQNVGFIPYRSAVLEAIERAAWRTLGRWVLAGADHVVLATPTADRFVRALLGPRLRACSTFPIGVDTDALRPPTPGERAAARAELGIEPAAPVVVFAVRLVEKKGVPVVLAAAERAPDVSFVVAGDGPLRGLLARPPSNVRWLGAVDLRTMVALYRAADAAVLPSQGEGLPVFVQEAMACGLPTVISDDEVYASALVAEGVAWGAAREANAMVRRLRDALAADAPARERVRAYAARHWGRDAMIERHVAVLRAIVASGAGAAR